MKITAGAEWHCKQDVNNISVPLRSRHRNLRFEESLYFGFGFKSCEVLPKFLTPTC